MEQAYKTEEVGRILKLSTRMIRKLIAQRELKAIDLGKKKGYRILETWINEYLQAHDPMGYLKKEYRKLEALRKR